MYSISGRNVDPLTSCNGVLIWRLILYVLSFRYTNGRFENFRQARNIVCHRRRYVRLSALGIRLLIYPYLIVLLIGRVSHQWQPPDSLFDAYIYHVVIRRLWHQQTFPNHSLHHPLPQNHRHVPHCIQDFLGLRHVTLTSFIFSSSYTLTP